MNNYLYSQLGGGCNQDLSMLAQLQNASPYGLSNSLLPKTPTSNYTMLFGKKEGMDITETFVAVSDSSKVIIDTDNDYDEIEKRVTKYLEKNIDKVVILESYKILKSTNKVIIQDA